MLIFLLAYLGGALTIVSPCILPVLPFVFARSDRPFIHSSLPLLIGMAVTFALVATLAAVAGGWAVAANQYGRFFAMLLMAGFGLTLLIPELADRLTQPLVALGARLSMSAGGRHSSTRRAVLASLLLGVATGLLWAPCAGPILGLILTGAALSGANATTTLLLVAYALGAATSLGLALLIGGQVFALMKRSLGVGQWVRRGLGAMVLLAVVAIGLGLDTGLLTQVSLASTGSLEQSLLNGLGQDDPNDAPVTTLAADDGTLPVEGTFPPLTGAVAWLNSPPLTRDHLKGKVVLVDFWTYSCINCIRAIPYVRAWADKYRDRGLVVIGVHSPEFAFEKSVPNVEKAIADLGIPFPVAIDNDFGVWRAFDNKYWPAHYFIDAKGQIRYHHYGEGEYDRSERVIQQLLAESGQTNVATDIVAVAADGVQAAASDTADRSPEIYVGYGCAANFVSEGGFVNDTSHAYVPSFLGTGQWALSGQWTVGTESAVLDQAGGTIIYRFHARDLHLVLGPSADGKPIRFTVRINGAAPGAAHGSDIDADGNGTVTGQRLYQLLRQDGPVEDRTFEITSRIPASPPMPSPSASGIGAPDGIPTAENVFRIDQQMYQAAAFDVSTLTKDELYADIALQLKGILMGETDRIANAANFSALLFDRLPDLNWTGFYFLDPAGEELVVGPFQGKPACVRIAVGRGVCGTAVAEHRSIVVADVHDFPRHIACDAASRSELVIPLRRGDEIIGVFDLDSPKPGRFDETDRSHLEPLVAALVASFA